MESTNIDSAQHYYNAARKRSFFYSRLFVILSMFILIIGLSFNLSLLYSNQKTTVASHAATKDSDGTLPKLPSNCLYTTVNNKVEIVCPSPTPSPVDEKHARSNYPIAITLPQLPAACYYQTTNAGYAISCANPQTIIPPTQVPLPGGCAPSKIASDKSISCTDKANKNVLVPLPELPQGCNYNTSQTGVFIACVVNK
jgi:hypothetical protein